MNVVKAAYKYFELFGAQGVAARAVATIPGTSNEFMARVPYRDGRVVIRVGTTDVAAFEHVFVQDEYGFDLDPTPKMIVDAGANVGMSAVYFALRYPHAKILAVEPDSTSFRILEKNARLFPQIIPIHAALWNRDGYVRLNDGGTGHWGMQVRESELGIAVRSLTLPSLLRQFEIERVGLLKMDVEGAECEIFSDAASWIGVVDSICVELHDRFRFGCMAAFNAATEAFPKRWRRGELHCAAR